MRTEVGNVKSGSKTRQEAWSSRCDEVENDRQVDLENKNNEG